MNHDTFRAHYESRASAKMSSPRREHCMKNTLLLMERYMSHCMKSTLLLMERYMSRVWNLHRKLFLVWRV